jgi:dolichyl-phosphate-mannose-protein mannosyltransferase
VQNIVEKKYWLILFCICLFAFVGRVYRLGEVKNYIFDEVYHTITAKLISRNDPRAYEWWNPPVEPDTAVDWLHPPLAKYTQALGMKVFGETPFGWRISATLFGVAVMFVIAEFVRFLFKDKQLALLAAFLSSLDGLLLTQSRIAMNDIHVALMLILVFFSYAWYRSHINELLQHPKREAKLRSRLRLSLAVTGICIGLAMGTKWSGFFGFLVVWSFEIAFFLTTLHQIAKDKKSYIKEIIARVIILGIIPFVVYVFSYSHMFLQGKTLICNGDRIEQGKCYCNQNSSVWALTLEGIAGGQNTWTKLEARGGCKRLISHFSELHNQIWWYQTNLKATHGYQSRPLDWFLNLRPVWFYVKYEQDKSTNIYAQGNPLLFWIGNVAVFASLLSIGLQAFQLLKTKLKTKQNQVWARVINTLTHLTDFRTELGRLFYLTVAYFSVWLPWQSSPRIMFFYHYTPAVPLLATLLAYWLLKADKFEYGKYLLWIVVAAITITFFLFYPNWTGITVPKAFADIFYFGIKTWK